MSTRREFARQVVGAIVGVSVVPAFGKKPKWHIPPVRAGIQFFPPTDLEKWVPYIMTDSHLSTFFHNVPLPTSQRSV